MPPAWKCNFSFQFHDKYHVLDIFPLYAIFLLFKILSQTRPEVTHMAENDELEDKIKKNKEKFRTKVRLLYAGDNAEWEVVYEEVVLVGLRFHTKNGHCLGKIIKNRGLSEYDVLSELYKLMIVEEKLDLYAYRGDLYAWMRNYVKEIVLRICKGPAIATDPDDIDDTADDIHDEAENSSDMSEMDALEHAFAELFKTNPEGAFILLLHEREGLTSNAICDVLGLPHDKSHINHVDNASRQALEEIKRILKQQKNHHKE
ncbi:MAG: hypothetical protein J6X49_00325 [Victivallales bacterium]|nr:hypothetical protein [Victivallales bacterium]